MKHWILLLPAVCVVAIACGGDSSTPVSPSSTGNTLVFTAQMSADNEVPHPTAAESTAHGATQITMHVTRDSANAISAATADFTIQMAGLAPDTTFVGAHIHPGVEGVAGPVIINTTLSSGTPQQLQGGAATWTFTNVTVPAATAQAIIANPAAFYFNVHTLSNPAGVARGQLQRTF